MRALRCWLVVCEIWSNCGTEYNAHIPCVCETPCVGLAERVCMWKRIKCILCVFVFAYKAKWQPFGWSWEHTHRFRCYCCQLIVLPFNLVGWLNGKTCDIYCDARACVCIFSIDTHLTCVCQPWLVVSRAPVQRRRHNFETNVDWYQTHVLWTLGRLATGAL